MLGTLVAKLGNCEPETITGDVRILSVKIQCSTNGKE
jgi:hypothetical protein